MPRSRIQHQEGLSQAHKNSLAPQWNDASCSSHDLAQRTFARGDAAGGADRFPDSRRSEKMGGTAVPYPP